MFSKSHYGRKNCITGFVGGFPLIYNYVKFEAKSDEWQNSMDIPLAFSTQDACVYIFKDDPSRMSASWTLRNTGRPRAANADIP